MSTKPRTRKGSRAVQRAGGIYLWSFDDDKFFQHCQELSEEQRRFYVLLRRGGSQRFVTEEWSPEIAEHADALKGIHALCALGIIVREDAEALGRRIKAEHSTPERRATN